MDLEAYVGRLRHEFTVAAEAIGQEATELTDRLSRPLESAIRLTLLDALSVAAEEITRELGTGSVDLRLRRDVPDFVVTPPADWSAEERADEVKAPKPPAKPITPPDADNGAMTRINLRLPENLKSRAEQAADHEELSTNAWIVRTMAAALDKADRDQLPGRRADRSGRRYTGWSH
ncbi:toxin-antitoxin system HicB family antitoxin [Streptomyces sp. P1-3]|uniref:toxin-antitoxin system HicB family antitoxin n=1 Tax=Streptomyces sp. P1-3 TaxID=3421658 RepID=UPI003D369A5C